MKRRTIKMGLLAGALMAALTALAAADTGAITEVLINRERPAGLDRERP